MVIEKMKSISKGYASLDYEMLEHRDADMVKVDLLIKIYNLINIYIYAI